MAGDDRVAISWPVSKVEPGFSPDAIASVPQVEVGVAHSSRGHPYQHAVGREFCNGRLEVTGLQL